MCVCVCVCVCLSKAVMVSMCVQTAMSVPKQTSVIQFSFIIFVCVCEFLWIYFMTSFILCSYPVDN